MTKSRRRIKKGREEFAMQKRMKMKKWKEQNGE
jgi:hypothetical protein